MDRAEEKEWLIRSKALFSYAKDIKGIRRLDDMKLEIENVCSEEKYEQLETFLQKRSQERNAQMSDGLLDEIALMIIRMQDYVEFSLKQKEAMNLDKQEIQQLKEERDQLKILVNGVDNSMQIYEEKWKKQFSDQKEKHERQIEGLMNQINRLTQEKLLQQQILDSQTVNLIQKEESIKNLQHFNSNLQQSLDQLNIDMVKLKAIHQGEVSAIFSEKSLKGLLTNKSTKHTILSYLEFDEILNLRLLNREYNLVITRDFQLQRILITHLNRNYNKKTNQLLNKANYFSNVAALIPDEVLKVSILKYLCQKNKVGESFLPAIMQAQQVLDGHIFDIDSKEDNKEQQQSQTSSKLFSDKSTAGKEGTQEECKIDIISEFYNDNINNKNPGMNNEDSVSTASSAQNIISSSPNQIPEQQESHSNDIFDNISASLQNQKLFSSTSKTFSFMKKLFDTKKSQPTQQQSQQPINYQPNLNVLPQVKVDQRQANQLLLDMNSSIQIDERISKLFLEESEVCSKQLKIQVDEVRERLSSISKECLQDKKKVKLFVEMLESSFCGLYIFGKYLYGECKAMYDLQQYLSFELIQNKMAFQDCNNKLEDITVSKKAVEQMKDYLQQRLKETERKNLQSDTIFLKNNKLIQELKDDNQLLNQRVLAAEKSKLKADTNLKILAKELRNQLRKIAETNEKYQKLLSNMNYLKDALSNFRTLEE